MQLLLKFVYNKEKKAFLKVSKIKQNADYWKL